MGRFDPAELENFTYQKMVRSFDIEEQQLKTGICRNLYNWWRSFEPNYPMRKDFDVLDHLHAAPHLFLIDILPDHYFKYRIQGEEVKRYLGANNAGVVFSRETDDLSLRLFAEHIHQLIEKKTASNCFGTMDGFGPSYLTFESFDFPLFDAEGNPSHILGVLVATGRLEKEK